MSIRIYKRLTITMNVLLSIRMAYDCSRIYCENAFLTNIILLSHLSECACEWAYECNSAPIRNDRKKSVGVSKHFWCLLSFSGSNED